MKNNFDLIIFDWDGTIANSSGTIVSSFKEMCALSNIKTPTDYEINSIIGLGLDEAFAKLFPSIERGEINRLQSLFREAYLKKADEISIFDGIELGIKSLFAQGYLLAIATGKSRRGLNNALNKSNLNDLFSHTKTIDECFSKPHPQMILEILDSLMIKPERTLMVGDSGYDLQMAVNAKVSTLAVTYGSQVKDQLVGYNALDYMDSPYEVFEWIGRYG